MRGISANHEDSANGVNTNSDTLATNAHLVHDFAAFADQRPAKTAGQLDECIVFWVDDARRVVEQGFQLLHLDTEETNVSVNGAPVML